MNYKTVILFIENYQLMVSHGHTNLVFSDDPSESPTFRAFAPDNIAPFHISPSHKRMLLNRLHIRLGRVAVLRRDEFADFDLQLFKSKRFGNRVSAASLHTSFHI